MLTLQFDLVFRSDQTSLALAKSLNEEEVAAGLLYPRLARLQEIS